MSNDWSKWYRGAAARAEIGAYFELLRREDAGKAFLKIMKSFELTREKRELYHAVLQSLPVQIIWSTGDTALPLSNHGERAKRAAGVEIDKVPGKHFFQEEQAPAIAEAIARV